LSLVDATNAAAPQERLSEVTAAPNAETGEVKRA
jgi:hypothetical protein